jgi:hypothetical protein
VICTDALFNEWPEADAIIGNPPFLGSSNFRKKGMTDDYILKMHSLYPDDEFPNRADLCAYWFRKAHDHQAGRCGLVATNSIAQGQSRKAGLSYIINHGGIIHNAIRTQPWSGEAKVHVSIVNWAKTQEGDDWVLDGEPVTQPISDSLTLAESTLTVAATLKQNRNRCFEGVKPSGKGFVIHEVQALKWIQQDATNADILKPFISGDPLTEHPELKPERWIIDFNAMPIEEASEYTEIFNHIKARVKPERDTNRRETTKIHWWHYGEKRPAMRRALEGLACYFVVPATSKWSMAVKTDITYLPGNSTFVIASDDMYVLGVLNSNLHRGWVKAQSSTLKGDTRYTNTTCFETFPFVWNAPEPAKEAVRAIATELNEYRLATMKAKNIGITQLYNQFFHEPASQLYQLHQKLDKAVCEHVYGWPYDANKNYNPELFALNQTLAKTENT